VRINHVYTPELSLDLSGVEIFKIDAKDTIELAELAPVIGGKPDITKITEIDLAKLGREFRLQKIIFKASVEIFDQMKHTWKGSKEYLLGQVVRLVERFIKSSYFLISSS